MRFYLALHASNALRGPPFCVDRKGGKSNQRAPKPPFGIWLFIRGLGGETCLPDYVFAQMQLTRFRPVRGVLRTASTDSIVLHVMQRNCWNQKNNRRNLWSEVGWLRKCFYLPWQRTPRALPTAMLKPRLRGAARRGKGISGAHPKGICFAAPQPT